MNIMKILATNPCTYNRCICTQKNLNFSSRVSEPVGLNKNIINKINNGQIATHFVPTPPQTVALMEKELGEIKPGDKILEPSAGYGHIADYLCEKTILTPHKIDVVEPVPDLRLVLNQKGYNLVEYDIMNYKPDFQYDKIIMNPPFEDSMDVMHVCHCFDLLKSGGTLVSILPEKFFTNNKCNPQNDWINAGDVKKYYDSLYKIIADNQSKTIPLGQVFLQSDVPDDVKTRILVIKKTNAKI